MIGRSIMANRMRLSAEAWIVILTVLGFGTYFAVVGSAEHRRFVKECSELGIDRMVELPSDDDLRRLVQDCARGRRSP
jgi:hypothetical protein